jgi:hypothetical protein
MPHPADHPLAAAAIVRALSNQLQKAKAAGDEATAAAVKAVLDRAQRIVKRGAAQTHPSPPPPRLSFPASVEVEPEGWAEIVSDRRQRPQRWR